MNVNRISRLSSLDYLVPRRGKPTLRIASGTTCAGRPAPASQPRVYDSKLKSILVPLDGSHFAEQAIPLALGIAEETGAVLHLVHVIPAAELLDPYDALHSLEATLKTLKRDKHRYLENVVGEISTGSKVFVASRVLDGRTVSSSLDTLPGFDADLIVMATHGRGPLGRFWTGSVAHSLLHQVSAPVIVVRGADEPVTLRAKSVDHVLLPFDGAPNSERVVRPMLDLEVFHGARHSLLHFVPLTRKRLIIEAALRTEWMPSRSAWAEGMEYLRPLSRSLRRDGRSVRKRVVNADDPFGEVILRCAAEMNVGLIAIAYQRQRALTSLLWPNTSEFLFRNSTKSVMFVPV